MTFILFSCDRCGYCHQTTELTRLPAYFGFRTITAEGGGSHLLCQTCREKLYVWLQKPKEDE